MPEVLSVCSVQYKCITDAQRRKAALPGRGLEYVDGQGARHEPVPFTFMAADGVEMPLEVGWVCLQPCWCRGPVERMHASAACSSTWRCTSIRHTLTVACPSSCVPA